MQSKAHNKKEKERCGFGKGSEDGADRVEDKGREGDKGGGVKDR